MNGKNPTFTNTSSNAPPFMKGGDNSKYFLYKAEKYHNKIRKELMNNNERYANPDGYSEFLQPFNPLSVN